MIFGVLMACMNPVDASSCTVVFYDQQQFTTMQECQVQMNDFARYAATNYRLITRPYCFEAPDHSV